ncbi:MAG: hypothetical protein K2Q07_01195 [Burkholderiaceae bacterium]|nr:hypothetical protein [Burkholderiaceae bacterium]
MQSASALQVTIRCFRVWNAALGLLSVVVVAAVAGWLSAWHGEPAGWGGRALSVLALVGLSGVVGLVRRQPIVLRWDTQRWHVTDPHRDLRDLEATDLRVMLDLGGWMLLNYRVGASSSCPWRSGWLPVQRRGIEGQWHSLRCAVHARGGAQTAWVALDRQVQRG